MAHVDDGDGSRCIVHLVDHAMDPDPQAVGAFSTYHLARP